MQRKHTPAPKYKLVLKSCQKHHHPLGVIACSYIMLKVIKNIWWTSGFLGWEFSQPCCISFGTRYMVHFSKACLLYLPKIRIDVLLVWWKICPFLPSYSLVKYIYTCSFSGIGNFGEVSEKLLHSYWKQCSPFLARYKILVWFYLSEDIGSDLVSSFLSLAVNGNLLRGDN